MSELQTTATATASAGQEPAYVRAYAPRPWVREYLGGISLSTLQRLEKDPTKGFPRPLRFGKCPLFNIEEVKLWAASHRA